MRHLLGSVACVGMAAFCVGCEVHEYRERPVYVERHVEVAPDVEVVEVEPAPEERVYVYEVGYPPGCYVYNGFYWYGGRRYEHDVFVTRVVNVNIREHRYVNIVENRRAGERIEVQHRQQFAAVHHDAPGHDSSQLASQRYGSEYSSTGQPRKKVPARVKRDDSARHEQPVPNNHSPQ